MIGAIISLVQLLRRASQPHVAFLGRIPGTRRFSDCERHPHNELIPGVLIFRPESSLIYFNVDYVRELVRNRVWAESPAPRLVVLDLSAAPFVDLQSVHTVAGLAAELTSAGIRPWSFRDRLCLWAPAIHHDARGPGHALPGRSDGTTRSRGASRPGAIPIAIPTC
jgi:hypothetical protein